MGGPGSGRLRRIDLPERHAAQPAADRPRVSRPSCLAGLAMSEWERLAPLLWADGRLTRETRALLAAYCRTYARLMRGKLSAHQRATLDRALIDLSRELRLSTKPTRAALDAARPTAQAADAVVRLCTPKPA